MSAVKDLHVDLQGARFVVSRTNASVFAWPKIFHNDNLNIAVRFLKANPDGDTQFSLVDISAASLTVKLWNSDGDTILASQTSWTADVANSILSAELDLNTANMVTELGALASISTTLEFTLLLSDGQYTVQQPLTIYRSLNAGAASAPEPADQYITLDQAKGLFAQFINSAGQSITLKSADGTKSVVLYVDNDGAFHTDPA